jgi:CheY-like chemotaxis protein
MPKKLLVADDSLTIQKVIRLALSGAASGTDSYEIQAVSDGNDAIQQISLFRPDIVLIDVSLPGKTAFEVKRATNQHRDLAHVRFVLMSSAFEKVDEAQVTEVGFDGRLTKPFDPAHLREVLGQVLTHAPAHTFDDSESMVAEQEPSVFLKNTPPPLPPGFPSMPPLAERASQSHDPESDIRNLTESTIRMSGLAELGETPQPPELPPGFPPEPPAELPEDFQWSVEERSLKPPSTMDSGDSTFPLAPPPRIPNEHSRFVEKPSMEELQLTPPPPPDVPFEPTEQTRIERFERTTETPKPPEMSSFAAESLESAINPAEFEKKIEDMVRAEVEKAIRKAAQETLPDVVERVIKEEIRKLLQDSP